jgi:hypothetical protein
MERLQGRTLEEATGGGTLARPELIPILRAVASALATAHSAGVVHGELRADNIFMAEVAGYGRGFPKLMDFGVARLTASAADERSDQLALAALASRLLAPTDATPAARWVLTRALSGNPDQRFNSVASFFQALEEALKEVIAKHPPAPEMVEAAPRPPEPSGLTQQFFAEGERQELAHAQGGPGGSRDDGDDTSAISGAFDRVPRSRARMFAAATLALASVAVMSWTVASLSRAHAPAGPVAMQSPRAEAVPVPRAPAPLPAPAPAAAGRARVARVSARPRPPRTEPLPLAATPPPLPADSKAAPPSPATPAPTPPPAADSPPPPAAAAAPPTDEDFTQPWEQTEGVPIEAAPVTAEPLDP